MRMQCIAWVYMNAQCATIKAYVPCIVDPSTAPRHFGAEAKSDVGMTIVNLSKKR